MDVCYRIASGTGRCAATIAIFTVLVLFSACAVSHSGGAGSSVNKSVAGDSGLRKIEHIVVIYMENHSFDNLYGEFPGADGLANAAATSIQVDSSGAPFAALLP